jgi:hypothetical protein
MLTGKQAFSLPYACACAGDIEAMEFFHPDLQVSCIQTLHPYILSGCAGLALAAVPAVCTCLFDDEKALGEESEALLRHRGDSNQLVSGTKLCTRVRPIVAQTGTASQSMSNNSTMSLIALNLLAFIWNHVTHLTVTVRVACQVCHNLFHEQIQTVSTVRFMRRDSRTAGHGPILASSYQLYCSDLTRCLDWQQG